MDHEDRIALFLDYENLALGVRDHHGGRPFDFRPIADALAERGRVVVRRAYADWSYFDEDRRMLTRSHVELIEIPQRMGASRKNAADIKMAVDAVELAFERGYISTFVICTGDSDFTPLVHKLRELNKRVIGVGVEKSTSALLPPACDEFLYYDRLEGVDVPPPAARRSRPVRPAPAEQVPDRAVETAPAEDESARDVDTLAVQLVQTVAGMQGSSSGEVTASSLKRALLRKDPTFSESDYGFRTFGELLRHLAAHNVVELAAGPAKGDPEVSLPEQGDREVAFGLLRSVVVDLAGEGGAVALSGLKDQLRRARPDFSEKKLGYRSFLQFCKAAATGGAVELRWSPEDGDYLLTPHTP
ncbi:MULTISPECIES: PIN domain-containing protein [unclassified Micromonospora]|uniref:PIN domain-containing protein n=1 Tax=unclassified Micromonospora TaxID=2617518 RepID=UPI001C2494A4|nr:MULTISPECIES: PIN domain-containing protein [unclassified Micromonospora]MBU8860798.1 NYN domain-containing protein [Micromonospora sp. WMMB482]MDM4780339.1 NYN domain-containing protein [Micromonospora sp. b486]MDM4784626.1 NYN domain-containing protein [Micromonospora sp. b486]